MTTVLSGLSKGCLKHLSSSIFTKLYKLHDPSLELVANSCISWWIEMLVTTSSWSKKCYSFCIAWAGLLLISALNFHTITSPNFAAVITMQLSYWALIWEEVYWDFEIILLGSSIVEAITLTEVLWHSILVWLWAALYVWELDRDLPSWEISCV